MNERVLPRSHPAIESTSLLISAAVPPDLAEASPSNVAKWAHEVRGRRSNRRFSAADISGGSGKIGLDSQGGPEMPRPQVTDVHVPAHNGRKTAHLVARQILKDILERGMAVGTRLPNEPAMQKEYMVSRSSLREALRILETYGIIGVKTGPGGGPYIRSTDVDDYAQAASIYFECIGVSSRDVVQAHLILEPMMARLAAQQISPQAADRIRRAMDRCSRSISGPYSEYFAASREFHLAVNGASDNAVLNFYASSLVGIRYTCISPTRLASPSTRRRLAVEHHAIAAAIINGDLDGAESASHAHLAGSSQRLSREVGGTDGGKVEWM